MKKVFINFTKYDGNEWVVIHHIGTDLNTSVTEFKKNLKESLSIGPDDCHTFGLVEVNLKNKDYDRLMTITLQEELDTEDLEFFEELCENYNLDNKYVCYDDNSGNYEVIRMYCADNNLDPDDDDDYEQACDVVYNDDQLYDEYLEKYITANF